MAQELQIAGSQPYSSERECEYVTMRVGGQLFGIEVLTVQDVLRGLKVTRIPLAPKAVAGSLNLRGRIVTAINLRECLGLPEPENPPAPERVMSVVVEHAGEFFSLIIDSVGEVMSLPVSQIEKSPANLSGRWKDVASGVYKMDNELLVILDVEKLLRF